MGPTELRKLELQVAGFQRAYEENETYGTGRARLADRMDGSERFSPSQEHRFSNACNQSENAAARAKGAGRVLLTKDIEKKADEAVMRSQRQEDLVDEDDVLEVVDNALAIEEVHGRGEPVPVQALGGLQVARAAGNARDGDDFLEGDDLDGGDNGDDVDVAHEEGREEASDHDESPERPGEEIGLLLLILGLLLLGGRWLLEWQDEWSVYRAVRERSDIGGGGEKGVEVVWSWPHRSSATRERQVRVACSSIPLECFQIGP